MTFSDNTGNMGTAASSLVRKATLSMRTMISWTQDQTRSKCLLKSLLAKTKLSSLVPSTDHPTVMKHIPMSYVPKKEDIKKRYKNAVIWIGGDLNLHDINWAINTVERNQNSSRFNKKIIEVVESCNLHQMVPQPTRKKQHSGCFPHKSSNS